jgi:hypothetical protein
MKLIVISLSLAWSFVSLARVPNIKSCQSILENPQSTRESFKNLSQHFIKLIYESDKNQEKINVAKQLYFASLLLLDSENISYEIQYSKPTKIPRLRIPLNTKSELSLYLQSFVDPQEVREIYFDLETLLAEDTEACTFDGKLFIDPLTLLRPKWNPTLAHEAMHLHFEANPETYFFENTEIHILDYNLIATEFPFKLPHEYQSYYSFSELSCYNIEVQTYEKALADPNLDHKDIWNMQRLGSQKWADLIWSATKTLIQVIIPHLTWTQNPKDPTEWIGKLENKNVMRLKVPSLNKNWHPLKIVMPERP